MRQSLWFLAALLASSAALEPVGAQAARPSSPLEALHRFMETWNSRDPEAWARSLHYPHTHQSATQGRVWQTAEEYAQGVDYGGVLRTGWHHSEWDSLETIHSSENKAHVAGQYTRYDAEGGELLTNQVTYIATNVDGEWGIRGRFAAGPLAGAAERAKSEGAALKIVQEYMEAFNARNAKAWAATLNYPHIRIASGTGRVWETAEEYAEWMDFDRFIRQTGWHHSRWDALRAIQVSTDGVNVALDFTRYDAEGEKIASYRTLYLITNQNGHWGVRARSSFAP